MQTYANILTPVDGSQMTQPVIKEAIQIALANKAHLDILNIIEVNQFNDAHGGTVAGDLVYNMVSDTEEQLAVLKKQAEMAGLTDVSVHVRFGNPKGVIAQEFPQDHHNDLTIIGTTGLSRIERLLVGSVTNYVMAHSEHDVLIVRH